MYEFGGRGRQKECVNVAPGGSRLLFLSSAAGVEHGGGLRVNMICYLVLYEDRLFFFSCPSVVTGMCGLNQRPVKDYNGTPAGKAEKRVTCYVVL